MLKKLKKGEHIFIIKSSSDLKNKSLLEFLSIPHLGVYVGDRILIDIDSYYPKDRKRNDSALVEITFELARIRFVPNLPKNMNIEDLKKVHFHVDGKGRIAYLSLPKEWVEKYRKKD